MPVWTTLDAAVQPELTLRSWQVMQLPDGDLHLVGYCIENQEGRTSSAVEAFDREQLVATTSTGRVYKLVGSPGGDLDAEYVWHRWARINGATEWKDIAPEIWSEVKRARAANDVASEQPLPSG